MSRKLKKYNGSVYKAGNQDHLYVAATSMKQVVEMLNECGYYTTLHQIKGWWNQGSWGVQMEGVEFPSEPTVYRMRERSYKTVGDKKPVKIYPK